MMKYIYIQKILLFITLVFLAGETSLADVVKTPPIPARQITDINNTALPFPQTVINTQDSDIYASAWNDSSILQGKLYDYSVNPFQIRNLLYPNLKSERASRKKSPQKNGFVDLTVGSFLDELQDNPALRSFYFTSKELNFTIRSKIANHLNTDLRRIAFEEIDHDPFDPRRLPENRKTIPQTPVEIEFTPMQKAFRVSMVDQIFESLGGFIFTVLALLGILFLTMRYVLIKYI